VIVKKLFIVAGVLILLPLLLGVFYLAAVSWAPMDSLTMIMPNTIRNTVSRALVRKADFAAKGFPAAARATKLAPTSEDAWTMYCATGAHERSDVEGTLRACSRAESMNSLSAYPAFHAQIIAEAYEEIGRPCDALPILRKTMGEAKVNNISPVFDVGRLEATCGQMDKAEEHLRAVVRLCKEDMLSNHWEDRPPGPKDPPNSYEKEFRHYLSTARQNLAALLTLRHQDGEAFQLCRAALGQQLSQCSCQFRPRNGVACSTSSAKQMGN
jgi:hypothetical protein